MAKNIYGKILLAQAVVTDHITASYLTIFHSTIILTTLFISSTGSSQPPPLPETIPPELSMRRLDSPGNDSSYYLPSTHESIISADEASDIDEDEITGLRSKYSHHTLVKYNSV